MRKLRAYLSTRQRRELKDIEACAENILAQPVDPWFTDHTIAHPRRIEEHLDRLLARWAEEQRDDDVERLQAELFVLLAAVYLHDIGMQMVKVANCPSLVQHCPRLVTTLTAQALPVTAPDFRFTDAQLDFVRKYHHVITHDWLANANLRGGRDVFPPTGLRTYADRVARVAWAHNVWLTDEASYRHFTQELNIAHEQVGDLNLVRLAAFLRLGDILDQDSRRVDISRQRRFDLPLQSRAHWWRHHFVRTCRLDDHTTYEGRRLHLVLSLPREHEADREWLTRAVHGATIGEIEAEHERLRRWLGAAAVQIRFPAVDECEVGFDASGAIEPMPPDVQREFRRIWPAAPAAAAQIVVREALAHDTLTATTLADSIAPLNVRAAIDEYIEQVRQQGERNFRDQPYTALELDYDAATDALDALTRLLERPNPAGLPVVVVGDPGGGKSTLMRRYVLACARGERVPGHVPLYIQANRYGDGPWAREIAAELGSALDPGSLAACEQVRPRLVARLLQLMAETLCELVGTTHAHVTAMTSVLREIMARRPCLIVFDGLNELTPVLRDLAIQAVRSFCEEYRNHRIVVTSRVGDYHEDYFPESPVYAVRPLSPEAIRAYWSALGIPRARQELVLAGSLVAVGAMASNPMSMYMLGGLLQSGDVERVQHSGALFRQFTMQLLRRWHADRVDQELAPEALHELFAEVAFAAFEDDEVSFTPTAVAVAWRRWWARTPEGRRPEVAADAGEPPDAPDWLVERLLSTTLLVTQGESDRLAFRHHTTQDYFAAEALPHHLDALPALVPRVVFHEPLRLLVGLLDDPNHLVRQVLRATSPGFGRAELLRLCFQIAGASPVPLAPDVRKLLFTGAVPLFLLASEWKTPFPVEVIAHLFAHLPPEALATYLAQLSKRDDLPPGARERASACSVAVLGHEGPWNEQVAAELLDVGIPPAIRRLYEQARQVLVAATGEKRPPVLHPLLIGGLLSTLSLNSQEKANIAAATDTLTLHQLHGLETIFVAESVEFGRLIAQEGMESPLTVSLIRETLMDVVLHAADTDWLAGDVRSAATQYFAAFERLEVKHGALARLIAASDELDGPTAERLLDVLARYDGADLRLGFRRRAYNIGPENIWQLLESRSPASRVRQAIEAVERRTTNPWLIVFYRNLLGNRDDSLLERLGELAPSLPPHGTWEREYLLEVCRHLASPARWQDTERMLGTRRGDQRERLRERLRERVRTLLAQPSATGAEPMAELVHEISLNSFLFEHMIEQLGFDETSAWIDAIDASDRSLGFKARCMFLCRLLVQEGAAVMHARRQRWGITVDALIHADPQVIGKYGTDEDAERAIWSLLSRWTREHSLKLVDDREPRIAVDILVHRKQFQRACRIATESITALCRRRGRPVSMAKRAFTLCIGHGDRAAKRELVDALYILLVDRHSAAAAVDGLEKLSAEQDIVDATECGRRIQAALTSRRAALRPWTRLAMLGLLNTLGQRELVRDLLGAAFLDHVPADPDEAASYLGNGGWRAYIASDFARFLELTELALASLPASGEGDWLLANRAFALLLLGRRTEALRDYAAARAEVKNLERWRKIALVDLESHTERVPGAAPLDPDILAAVQALGADLPSSAPSPDSASG